MFIKQLCLQYSYVTVYLYIYIYRHICICIQIYLGICLCTYSICILCARSCMCVSSFCSALKQNKIFKTLDTPGQLTQYKMLSNCEGESGPKNKQRHSPSSLYCSTMSLCRPVSRQTLLQLFHCFFLCSKEHFSIIFVQNLGVTAGIEPATQQCIPGALAH